MLLSEILFSFFTFLFLLIASWSDIETRQVSNKLTYFFLLFMEALLILASFYYSNFQIFFMGNTAMIFSLIVSLALYSNNIWGGADAKLFPIITLTLPYRQTYEILFYPCIFIVIMFFLGLIYYQIYRRWIMNKRRKYIPLVPLIYLAYVTFILLYLLLHGEIMKLII